MAIACSPMIASWGSDVGTVLPRGATEELVTVEPLYLTRLIQPAEQVVEGPVLKHHRHDMIEPRTALYSGHRSTSLLTPRQQP